MRVRVNFRGGFINLGEKMIFRKCFFVAPEIVSSRTVTSLFKGCRHLVCLHRKFLNSSERCLRIISELFKRFPANYDGGLQWRRLPGSRETGQVYYGAVREMCEYEKSIQNWFFFLFSPSFFFSHRQIIFPRTVQYVY